MKLRTILPLVVPAFLMACASPGGMSLENPEFFVARQKDGTITGQYNPEGFSTAEVRRALGAACLDENLTGFGETATETVLVAFSGKCSAVPAMKSASIEVQKSEAGSIVVEVFGGIEGDLQLLTFEV